MSWVATGVALVGAVSANSSGRRGARNATRVAEERSARLNPLLANTGYTVATNDSNNRTTSSGTTPPPSQGPSFTFGGNNGAVAPVAPGQGVPSEPIDPNNLSPGFRRFGEDGAFIVNDQTGQVWDSSGSPVTGRAVAPGSSFLDIDIPDYGEARGFSTGVNIDDNVARISDSSERIMGLNQELQSFRDQVSLDPENPGQLLTLANQAGELLPLVSEGNSELRNSRLAQIDGAERRTVSDLEDSMAQRRVAGSSFANDSLSNTRSEFARQRSDVEAQATLEEVSATAEILGFQANLISQSSDLVLRALQQESNNEAIISNNEIQSGNLEIGQAQVRLGEANLRFAAEQASFASQVAALQLAFQGNQQAQDYIIRLQQLANGATEMELGAIQFGTQQRVDGTLGIATAGSGFASAGAETRRQSAN